MSVDLVAEKTTDFLGGSEEPTVANACGQPRAKVPLSILCVVGALYLALSFHLFRASLSGTGNNFTFPLDDTYITMAVAKNIALHGVLGTSRFRFASATSCPGFLLLLAGAFRLTGPTEWWPLALSLGFGLLTLVMAWRLLGDVGAIPGFLALMAIVLLTPLHVLGLLGMEHTLHLALSLAFLNVVGWILARRQFPSWGALLLTSAMVSVRFEGLFMAAVACLLFLVQKQMRAAVALGIAAVAPVATYGVFSVLHGGYWLANSIALKGFPAHTEARAPLELVGYFLSNLHSAPYMGMLLGVMVALLAVPGVVGDIRSRGVLGIVFGATLFTWRWRVWDGCTDTKHTSSLRPSLPSRVPFHTSRFRATVGRSRRCWSSE